MSALKHFRILFFILVLPMSLHGQQSFRIKADFSIKEKSPDGGAQLTMGKVYYDKSFKQILYNINFPEAGKLVVKDSLFYRIKDEKVLSAIKSPLLPEFSIFHLSLNGNLSNYGLNDSFYKIEKVEKENNMVITTWMPDAKYRKVLGKIVMSSKSKQLFGIAFFNPEGKLLNKQLFRKYEQMSGLSFPTEIIQISYTDAGEKKMITTYRNLVVDDLGEDTLYHYTIPQ